MPKKEHLRTVELDGRVIGTRTSVYTYTHAVARVAFSTTVFREAQLDAKLSGGGHAARMRTARYQAAFAGLKVGDRHPCGVGEVIAEDLRRAEQWFAEAGGSSLDALVNRLRLEDEKWIAERAARLTENVVEVMTWHPSEERALVSLSRLERKHPWSAYRILPVRSHHPADLAAEEALV